MENIHFSLDKTNILSKIDKSNKQSYDTLVTEIIELLNSDPNFVTTSSCSGRAALLSYQHTSFSKKSCSIFYSTHEKLDLNLLNEEIIKNSATNDIIFKYEGFVLHVLCANLKLATEMLHLGIEAGYKNSGIVLSKRDKITVALRSSLTTEIPLTNKGSILVSPEHLNFIVLKTNDKIEENEKRIQKFLSLLENYFLKD